VARQDTGTAGTLETGQRGGLGASARAKGRPWLDRERDRPTAWTADGMRGRDAGMPDTIAFPTKPPVARVLLERTLAAGVPAQGVAGDAVYGHDGQQRLGLERRPHADGLAGPAHESVWQGFVPRRVRPLVDRLAPGAWHRVSAGAGAQGPRWDAGALVPRHSPLPPGWQRWRRARRSLETPTAVAYSGVVAPATTRLQAMVRAAGSRWRSAAGIDAAKGAVGLEAYVVRGWLAWYRPIT